jgi:perosamine synthetase
MKVPPAAIYVPEEDRAWILERIDECLKSGRLTLGANGEALEEAFANLCGVRYAAAVSSGTSALEIILRAAGVAGREVIVPTNTFFATPAAVLHAGATVRFADCDPSSFALDVESLRRSISSETAAVVVVHIGGIITPQIEEVRSICEAAGVALIEDAAHAHGSQLKGRVAGSFGKAAAFSFYPTKVITTAEGGMIVTDDEAIYREALIYRDQGKEGFTTNYHVRLGANWRMSEPHAIIGLAQLRRLDEFIERRQAIAAVYDRELAALGPQVTAVTPPEGSSCNYYKYIALLRDDDRAELKRVMREEFDVGLSGEVYDTPCHLQPVFAGIASEPLPQAEDICARHICLPVSAVMTEDDAHYVIDSLKRALERVPARAGSGS